MSIRALTSLLARRLSRAQPASSPAGRPARSLHTLRDLTVGRGGALGAFAVAAFAGLAGTLYLKRDAAQSAGGEEARKEAAAIKQGDAKEAAVKEESFDDNGDDIPWDKVIEDIEALVAAKKRARRDRYWSAIANAINKVAGAGAGREPLTEDEIKEEAAMKARFEDWMEEHGRTYKSEREKARRYEIFKAFAKKVDIANAKAKAGKGGACFVTNHTADWTDDEFRDRMCGGEFPYEDYLDHIKSFAAKKKALRNKEVPHSSKAI